MALENLGSFTGSENFHRNGMNRKFIYTDGAKYVADEAGAYWLIDDIAIANAFDQNLKGEEFQTWTLTKTGNSATLIATDGNDRVLYSKGIEYTDFPLDSIKFYVVSAEDFGVNHLMLMLPSEY